MLYPRLMSTDPPSTSAAWHSRLAEKDKVAHERMSAAARDGDPQALRRRLESLGAELAVLRSAVDVRSRLLHEQSVALGERDALISELRAVVEQRGGEGSLARRTFRRGRRLAGRVVRKGLRTVQRVAPAR